MSEREFCYMLMLSPSDCVSAMCDGSSQVESNAYTRERYEVRHGSATSARAWLWLFSASAAGTKRSIILHMCKRYMMSSILGKRMSVMVVRDALAVGDKSI